VTTLAPITLYLADSHTDHFHFLKSRSYGIQEMWADDRFNLFHLFFSFTF
jgi:hypothetical protein